MPIGQELVQNLLERCERLGLACAVTDEAGRVQAWSPSDLPLDRMMRTGPMHSGIADASVRAGHGGAFAELWAGFTVLSVSVRSAGAMAGRLLCFVPARGAMDHPALADICRAANVDRRLVRDRLRGLSATDHPPAEWLIRVLVQQVEDAANLLEQNDSLAGFGARLGESFDTIEVLYTIGRSMRGPFQSDAFMTLVCQSLRRALPLGWIAAVFDSTEGTARGLRGGFHVAGDAPIEMSGFEAACRGLVQMQPHGGILTERIDLSPQTGQVLRHPVHCKGRVAGVVLAGGKAGDDAMVTSYESQLVEAAAGHLSAFADNMALYEDQHDLFMGTLHALTAAIDAKDRYTRGHSERVAWMSCALATQLGLPAADAERIRIAGLVHDVGKIGVPERVLTKPGKLSDDEFAFIKQHPTIGHEILRDIPQLSDVLPGVLHHHEKYDGRGYPHGLAGGRIPLIARIIAVADTFDAMSSTRSYRPAMPREKVISEIERVAGTQLDPEVAMLVRTMDLSEFDRLIERHAAADVGANNGAPGGPNGGTTLGVAA